MTITIDDQIKEVAREIAMRKNVYPRFVERGQLTEAKAVLQMTRLEAVMETLKNVQAVKMTFHEKPLGGCPQCGHRHPPDGMCVT